MKNTFFGLILTALAISGCNIESESSAFQANLTQPKLWTFIQFNVPEEDGKSEDYYYYGNISKNLYEKISANELESGFLLMEDVKYWGNDDIIHDYRDSENSGDLVFRIEDIKRISRLNKEPETGKGSEQFSEDEDEQEQEQEQETPSTSIAQPPNSLGHL